MVSVTVIAHRREDRRSDPLPCEADRDVAREPADGPDEGVGRGERGPRRRRRDVHPDPTHDKRLDHDSPRRITPDA